MNKIKCNHTNEIHVAYVGFEGDRVQPSNDGLNEEGSKPPLVQHVGDHVGECLGLHLPALLELVHVHPELYLLLDSLDVSGQAW